jgi:nucleotidyltransferase/DNA polymerase involved in DNA repair
VRIVAHVDMDAFYAAVEAQRNPALRDRPLVVGADPKEGHGRGVVTAASYAARRYGIRSALPISRAWRLAQAARRRGEPETIFVRDDHALYREVSARIMAILAAAGDAFQKTSVDEAYLELSSLGSFDAAVERARRLKAEIVSQEGLTASVGIGPNKLVAKIASDFEKPDGLTIVRAEEVQLFLDPLRIRVIPGIGPKTERFLHERHIRTVADLRTLERAQLAEWFGRWGEDLFAKVRGPAARRGRARRPCARRRSSSSCPSSTTARIPGTASSASSASARRSSPAERAPFAPSASLAPADGPHLAATSFPPQKNRSPPSDSSPETPTPGRRRASGPAQPSGRAGFGAR